MERQDDELIARIDGLAAQMDALAAEMRQLKDTTEVMSEIIKVGLINSLIGSAADTLLRGAVQGDHGRASESRILHAARTSLVNVLHARIRMLNRSAGKLRSPFAKRSVVTRLNR